MHKSPPQTMSDCHKVNTIIFMPIHKYISDLSVVCVYMLLQLYNSHSDLKITNKKGQKGYYFCHINI